MDADGAGQTNLTGDAAVDDGAAWSPDGTKVAYTSGQGRNAEVIVIDADGNNRTALTDNLAFDGEPTWSPDGTADSRSPPIATATPRSTSWMPTDPTRRA